MDTFIEEQRAVNVQANQKIDKVESSLNKELDGFPSEIDKKFDDLQCLISRLVSQQHVHQEEENMDEECLSDTMVEEQCQRKLLFESSDIGDAVCPWEKKEVIFLMLTEEGSGRAKKTYLSTNSHKIES